MKRNIFLMIHGILGFSMLVLGLSLLPTSSAHAVPEFCKDGGFTFLIGARPKLDCMRYLREGGLAWDALDDWRIAPDNENPTRDQYGNLDTWTYMWSTTPDRNPDNYLAFANYTINEVFQEFWDNSPNGIPRIGLGGSAFDREFLMLRPTVQHLVVVRWKSPFSGHVSFWGWFYPHEDAGDGINWYIQHQHESQVTILAEGTLNSGGPEYAKKASFGFSSLEVSQGDFVYFVVGAGATDTNDRTLFNVSIIGPKAID